MLEVAGWQARGPACANAGLQGQLPAGVVVVVEEGRGGAALVGGAAVLPYCVCVSALTAVLQFTDAFSVHELLGNKASCKLLDNLP